MITAVLFDLDGTLLDIDLASFFTDYFAALGPVIGAITGLPQRKALEAVMEGTEAMQAHHPGETNQAVFERTFQAATGVDLSEPEASALIDAFYRDDFPGLQGVHGPQAGAARAVAAAVELGLKVAIATNPIFPQAAIAERIRWAGLDISVFETVTSYENSPAAKPHAAYYRDVAEALGVEPTECLMVGDDPVLDLAAADVGMKTFYVGGNEPVIADWTGRLEDLPGLLARLVS